MMNDLNKHKRSDTVKWIIVFACIILLSAGLLATMTNGFTDLDPFDLVETEAPATTEDADTAPESKSDAPLETGNLNTVQVVNSDLMKLSVTSLATTADEETVVNSRATSGVGVIATVLPEGADSPKQTER